MSSKKTEDWSSAEVQAWLKTVSDVEEEDVEIFKKNRINGKTLLKLTKDDLKGMGFPVGVAVLIHGSIDEIRGASSSTTSAPASASASASSPVVKEVKKGLSSAPQPAPFKKIHLAEQSTIKSGLICRPVMSDDPDSQWILDSETNARLFYIFKKNPEGSPMLMNTIPYKKHEGYDSSVRDLNFLGDKAVAVEYENGYTITIFSISSAKVLNRDKYYVHNGGQIYRARFLEENKIVIRALDFGRPSGDQNILQIRDVETCKPITTASCSDDYGCNDPYTNSNMLSSSFDPYMLFYQNEKYTALYDIRAGLNKVSMTFVCSERSVPKISFGYSGGPGIQLLTSCYEGKSKLFDIRKEKAMIDFPAEYSSKEGSGIYKNLVVQRLNFMFDTTDADHSMPTKKIGTGEVCDWVLIDEHSMIVGSVVVPLK